MSKRNEETMLIRITQDVKNAINRKARSEGLSTAEFVRRSLMASLDSEVLGEPFVTFEDGEDVYKIPFKALKRSKFYFEKERSGNK